MESSASPRAYRSALRTRQAQETRERVIEAAGALFSQQGYQATTISAIARAADVSAETVKATASKPELLIASFEMRFAGAEGRTSLADTPIAIDVTNASRAEFLDGVITIIAEANARGHSLWTVLLGAALSDDQVARALSTILTQRRADYRRLVDELIARGEVIDDPDAAAAELSFLLSPEGYQQLVQQSGWTMPQYRAWLARSVDRALAV